MMAITTSSSISVKPCRVGGSRSLPCCMAGPRGAGATAGSVEPVATAREAGGNGPRETAPPGGSGWAGGGGSGWARRRPTKGSEAELKRRQLLGGRAQPAQRDGVDVVLQPFDVAVHEQHVAAVAVEAEG